MGELHYTCTWQGTVYNEYQIAIWQLSCILNEKWSFFYQCKLKLKRSILKSTSRNNKYSDNSESIFSIVEHIFNISQTRLFPSRILRFFLSMCALLLLACAVCSEIILCLLNSFDLIPNQKRWWSLPRMPWIPDASDFPTKWACLCVNSFPIWRMKNAECFAP